MMKFWAMFSCSLFFAFHIFALTIKDVSPQDGERVSGAITVRATVTDAMPINKVLISVDGGREGMMIRAASDQWFITGASTSLADGIHDLRIRAETDISTTTVSTTQFVVRNSPAQIPCGAILVFTMTLPTMANDLLFTWVGNNYWRKFQTIPEARLAARQIDTFLDSKNLTWEYEVLPLGALAAGNSTDALFDCP